MGSKCKQETIRTILHCLLIKQREIRRGHKNVIPLKQPQDTEEQTIKGSKSCETQNKTPEVNDCEVQMRPRTHLVLSERSVY